MKVVKVPVERSRIARLARFLAALSVPVLVLTALGSHFGQVPADALMPAIATGIGLGLIATILAVYALCDVWVRGSSGANHAFAALFRAAPALVLSALVGYALLTYPMVNDVSTSPDFPPEFLVLDYDEEPQDAADEEDDAEETVLTGRLYPLDAARVFTDVNLLVGLNDWEIVDIIEPTEDFNGGRIEAVVTTPVFGFRDLVAIRIAEEPEGTRVDLRSASIFSPHDLGQNTRRIRRFLTKLDASLQGERNDLTGGSDGSGQQRSWPPIPQPRVGS